ncbi:MAG: J domain-containing protein [Actinomycetota bacterium]
MSEPVNGGGSIKHSYTIPCASAFRDAVDQLATRRKVNVGDIARSVLLVVPAEVIAAFPDPGEPATEDRETVILKSGPAQGRPWRRKPRLQVRMAPGYQVEFIRRALGLALSMETGAIEVRLHDPKAKPAAEPPPPPPPGESDNDRRLALAAVGEEIERLKAIINVLSFDPLPNGVQSREDALHVLGFPPGAQPDRKMLRAKFRMLATIHHPDSNYGSHHRMSQLNAAMEMLRDYA